MDLECFESLFAGTVSLSFFLYFLAIGAFRLISSLGILAFVA